MQGGKDYTYYYINATFTTGSLESYSPLPSGALTQ